MKSLDRSSEMVSLMRKGVSYNYEAKESLTSMQRAWLKALVKVLGLPTGSFDIRVNRAGIAVAADVTLHTEELYVQFSNSSGHMGALIRSCKGRKDYTGGPNQYLRCDEIDTWSMGELACRILKRTAAHAETYAQLLNDFTRSIAA